MQKLHRNICLMTLCKGKMDADAARETFRTAVETEPSAVPEDRRCLAAVRLCCRRS